MTFNWMITVRSTLGLSNSRNSFGRIWDYAGVIASHRGEQVLTNPRAMPGAKWFPEAKTQLRRELTAPSG